jgi:hypothetical protein
LPPPHDLGERRQRGPWTGSRRTAGTKQRGAARLKPSRHIVCEARISTPRRSFIGGAEIPVARLLHIVTSKHAAGRDKDKLFLATHRDALEQLLKREDRD